MNQKPLIGCSTYYKHTNDNIPLEIYGLMPSYARAIYRAGGIPILIPLNLPEEDLASIMERIDGLLLPGGGDISPDQYNGTHHHKIWGIDTERDRVEISLAQNAAKLEKPLLAICRGIQALNVAFGGTLWEDVGTLRPSDIRHDNFGNHPRNYLSHEVEVSPNSMLARQLETTLTRVNSLHHQAVKDLGSNLKVTATASDGLIEGVEIVDYIYGVGVQWHPENLIDDDPAMLRLFSGLVEAAAV